MLLKKTCNEISRFTIGILYETKFSKENKTRYHITEQEPPSRLVEYLNKMNIPAKNRILFIGNYRLDSKGYTVCVSRSKIGTKMLAKDIFICYIPTDKDKELEVFEIKDYINDVGKQGVSQTQTRAILN